MRWCLIIGGLLAGFDLASLHAQSAKAKIEIQSVRIGLPAGPHSTEPNETGGKLPIFKQRSWTPVYVDLKCLQKLDGPAELVLEVSDADGTLNRIRTQLAVLQTGEQVTVMGYTRPSGSDQLVASVVQANQPISAPFSVRLQGRESYTTVYLTIGSKLAGLKLPTENKTTTHVSLTEVATIVDVAQMPTVWYGYDGVDVAILNTSNTEFITALQNDKPSRLAVLAEWVRRGGRLIVCAGTNQQLLAQLSDLQPLLPMKLNRLQQVQALTVDWTGISRQNAPLTAGPGKSVEFTEFQPKNDDLARSTTQREYRVIAKSERTPLVVQGAYGLGRVTVVAIDLDRKPFTDWTKEQVTFWDRLLAAATIRPVSNTNPNNEVDGVEQLVQYLDQFEGVPVISFGWVALFILLYILVVGPLDYYILKKVVKRLELTWITFPTIVLIVSVLAYVTAYTLKGNDQKINKVDLLDIDLQTGRCFGTSWFSIFSPRIQNYTIAVEPTIKDVNIAEPVSWFGKSNANHNRLFRQVYDYADQASGLKNVPLRVWSSKAFTAQYAGAFELKNLPIGSTLVHPAAQADRIQGSIINRLPFALDKAVLLYAGKAYELGKLLPDAETPVVIAQSAPDVTNWLSSTPVFQTISRNSGTQSLGEFPFWRLAFADKLTANSAMRATIVVGGEQSWRLTNDNRSEAILLATTAVRTGPAEEMSQATAGPSRLWLNAIPSGNVSRTAIAGTLRQETFVRVFIPIASLANTK